MKCVYDIEKKIIKNNLKNNLCDCEHDYIEMKRVCDIALLQYRKQQE